MYHYYKWGSVYVIRKREEDWFIFGPFESESDAHMICEMLNAGKILFPEDVENGKKDIEDAHAVHEHHAE